MNIRHFTVSRFSALACVLGLWAPAAPARGGVSGAGATQPALSRLTGLPLRFEAADSRAGDPKEFLACGHDYEFLISAAETRFIFRNSSIVRPLFSADEEQSLVTGQASTRAVRMEFTGADPHAPLRGGDALAARINYLKGQDPAQWRSGVTNWSKVEVEGLYPGVDLVYYGNQQQLECDFTVAAGTNPAVIAIHFDGVDKITISPRGELVLSVGTGEIRQPAPVLYQMGKDGRRNVNGGYKLRDSRTVEFTVGRYDHGLPLVIDPILSYSTLFSGNAGTSALAVKVDTSGSIYMAGVTLAREFAFSPTNGYQTNFQGGTFNGDGFIAKLDSTGTNLIFFTYLGGRDDDGIYDMALDSSNNVYVTGFTDSPDFPVVPPGGVPGLPQGVHIGGVPVPAFGSYRLDCFVTELAASGTNLVFSTYLGGSAQDIGGAIAVDASNYVYVSGVTRSTNFPLSNPLVLHPPGGGPPYVIHNAQSGNEAFVTKFAPSGSGLVYSTYLGGDTYTAGGGIAADAAGFAYVCGGTSAANFAVTTNALQQRLNRGFLGANPNTNVIRPTFDAFLCQIAPLGSNLVYSTFLGGTNDDLANRLTLDANTNVYIVGYSGSPDFTNTVPLSVIRHGITNGPPNGTNAALPNTDAFIAKMSFATDPPSLVYSCLFGGTNNDAGWGVAVDTNGNAFVLGITGSLNLTTTNTFGPLAATNSGYRDVFVTVFNTNASALLYSVYLGGAGGDYGYGIALDAQDDAYIVGQTHSVNFPTVDPFAPPISWNNAFLAEIQMTVETNQVVIETEPTNLPVVVDGVTLMAPITNNWLFSSVHTIAAATTNSGGTGVQYVWDSWSDGGFPTHSVTVLSNVIISASYDTQYLLTMAETPGGVSSPSSGWFEAGSNVLITAMPGLGNTFSGWTGVGSGSFSGTNSPALATMNGPISETATFGGPQTDLLTVITNGNGTVSPDYNGRVLQAGSFYTVTAMPGPGSIFSSWNGGPGGTAPQLTFQMEAGLVLQANFIPNPFLGARGSYAGLFFDTNNVAFESSGYFSATVSSNGSFSATLRVGATPYSLSGQFSLGGQYSTSIARTNLGAIQIALLLDLTGSNVITGLVSDGSWTATLAAYRNVYSATSPAPGVGRYIWYIPGGPNPVTQPGGSSFGAVTVASNGNVTVGGTLADGIGISQSTVLSPLGQVPFYVPLYSGKGSILGWLTFSNQTNSDLSGAVNWFRPPLPEAGFYRGGFTLPSEMIGSIFSNSIPFLGTNQGQLVITGGPFTGGVTNPVTIHPGGIITSAGSLRLVITYTPASGFYRGVVLNPVSGAPISVSGAMVQKPDIAPGFYLFNHKSQPVFLVP